MKTETETHLNQYFVGARMQAAITAKLWWLREGAEGEWSEGGQGRKQHSDSAQLSNILAVVFLFWPHAYHKNPKPQPDDACMQMSRNIVQKTRTSPPTDPLFSHTQLYLP